MVVREPYTHRRTTLLVGTITAVVAVDTAGRGRACALTAWTHEQHTGANDSPSSSSAKPDRLRTSCVTASADPKTPWTIARNPVV